MKTNKAIKNTLRHALSVLLAFSAVMFLTACPDDGGSGGKKRATTRNGDVRTRDGVRSTDLLASGIGNTSSYNTIQLALDFFATDDLDDYDNPYGGGGGIYGGGYYGGGYNGPVEADGYMYVEAGSTVGCTIPDGKYRVRTDIDGTIDGNGTVYNVLLTAEKGGIDIRMRLDYAVFMQATPNLVSCGGETFPSELLGEVTVESIDEYPCYNTKLYFNTRNSIYCD